MDSEDAREFWARFDQIRGKRTVKDILQTVGIDYDLIRIQRTRRRLPNLMHAVFLAQEIGTTVEYLVLGMGLSHHRSLALYDAYINSSDEVRRIVDIALRIDKNAQNQTKKLMSI